MKKPKIYIIDVTNRDGVQTAKLGLSKLEKTMINLYLDEMGIFRGRGVDRYKPPQAAGEFSRPRRLSSGASRRTSPDG